MIPQSYITAWRRQAPWQENYQVEQDLIIHRALIEIFTDDFLKERLAFRGGTALHKLYLSPAKILRRYRPGSGNCRAIWSYN